MELGSSIFLLAALLLFARKRVVLLAYATATAAILAFMQVKYVASVRHIGHLFLVFVACLWIFERLPAESSRFHFIERVSRLLATQRQKILTCLLCVHFAVAAIASYVDWKMPFSEGKSAAAFLRANGMANMFMVGNFMTVATVAGYLDRGIYYAPSQSIRTFIVWNRAEDQPPQSLADVAISIATLRREKVLIISSDRLNTGANSVHEVAEFTGSIAREDFYLYLVNPDH
jgi:hypothetical protein